MLKDRADVPPVLAVPAARLQLLAGGTEEAVASVTGLLWQPGITPRLRLELLLLLTVGEDRLGRHERAVDALGQGVELARRHQLHRPLSTVARALLARLAPSVPGPAELLAVIDLRAAPELYPDRVELVRLTKREQVVLEAMAAGLDAQATARQLYVLVATVRSQRQSLYKKLDVHARHDAVARAREWGLLAPR